MENDLITNPPTGDNIMIFAIILGVAVLGVIVIAILNRKKNKKDRKKQSKH